MRKQMIKMDSSFGDICLLTAGMRHIINLFIQCLMETLLRIHFATHDYKRTKQLMHPKHCFCGCFYSYECIFKMSLNKRIWKNIVMLFRGFQEIKIIPRGSFHVPKPKINGVRSCDFRPDFVTANAILVRETVWLSRMHYESNYCYVRNEERFETDRLGFISWLDDVMEEKKELE